MPRTGNDLLRMFLTGFVATLLCVGCTVAPELTVSDMDRLSSPTVQSTPNAQAGEVHSALFEHNPPAASASYAASGPVPSLPRELEKVSHPSYVIEPPDTLLIDAVRLVPRPPVRIQALDTLGIVVTNPLPKAPIESSYLVDPSGTVSLGYTYGTVNVRGLTLPEIKERITEHLKKKLNPPYDVFVTLLDSRAMQQVRGEHLVRQDGTIGLGTYGSVHVTGLTIAQATTAIEDHLSQFLFEPKVSVDVSGFNSHVYYVIFDYPGTGQVISRLPITGNEHVLDAISQLRSIPPGVSKQRMWVARPAPAPTGRTQILPVDWTAITRRGETATNYQLLPGDRVFVAYDQLAWLDIAMARFFAPVERAFGITLLGNSVVQSISNPNGFGSGVR